MAPLLTEEESALDPYVILEIAVGATDKDIKKAYRQLSLRYHPDKNPTPEAEVKLRQVQLSREILDDPAKRAYVDTKLESDRRRREKYAASDKRKQEMIDALVQREEAAKKARVEAGKRRQQEAAEEEIKEAGKRMLEEAQKRRAAATSAAAAGSTATATASSNGTLGAPSTSAASNGITRPTASASAPEITPLDLTLILQFPSSADPTLTNQETLRRSLVQAYGPISHVFIKDPPPSNGVGVEVDDGRTKKKAKVKGRKPIVEFERGNWGGCWSCWKDLDTASPSGRNAVGVEGVKVKWAAGKVPDWVEWAATTTQQRPPAPQPTTSKSSSNTQPPSAATATAPSFDSAPDFGQATMADLLASHRQTRDDADAKKRQEADFESMTLLRMRQLERDRLAEQIRREEEDEGVM